MFESSDMKASGTERAQDFQGEITTQLLRSSKRTTQLTLEEERPASKVSFQG